MEFTVHASYKYKYDRSHSAFAADALPRLITRLMLAVGRWLSRSHSLSSPSASLQTRHKPKMYFEG